MTTTTVEQAIATHYIAGLHYWTRLGADVICQNPWVLSSNSWTAPTQSALGKASVLEQPMTDVEAARRLAVLFHAWLCSFEAEAFPVLPAVLEGQR